MEIYETLTPFPVHGLEHALGYRDTQLHTAGFLFGATGTTLALSVMSWVMVSNYPINFGGKPNWPLPSFIPITELTVLFASIGMVLVYCVRNKLFPGHVPRIYDKRTTNHHLHWCLTSKERLMLEVEVIKSALNSNGAVER